MNEPPQTWHYGLIAQWWAEFNVANPDELAYYRAVIEHDGQPALDLACGTGRLLLPLLQAGLDVDGCDLSPDMLALCRQRARAQDAEALRRCYQHLAPGGTLVFSHYLPYGNAEQWAYWQPEQRRQLPQAWPASGTRRRAANGDEYELRSRIVDLDPLEQRLTLQMRAVLWRAGQRVAEEEQTLQENLYFRNEVLLLLTQAGFGEITVQGGYTAAPATPEQTMLVFSARK